MRNVLTTVIATCFFAGVLYGHGVNYSPEPMILTFGGQDGTIAVVIVGDEPSPDCEVTASAQPQGTLDLVSVTPASPQPAPNVILNVHVLRQPHGSSESVQVFGRWISAGIPAPPCIEGVTDIISIRVTVNLTTTGTEPIISSVINGASFLPGIQAGSWTTIRGTNLANSTRTWNAQTDIINGKLPTELDGVSATIDGKAASMYYISPGQINVLASADDNEGPVEVRVKNSNGTSNPVIAQLQKYSPAFFLFDPQNRKYIAALIARTDGKVDYLGPIGLFGSALATRPAKPGEIILLYGTGFGPTNPAVPSGMVFNGAAPLTDKVTIIIGGVAATVQFAGVTGAGLYQFNVVVPNLADGDQKVVAIIGGLSSQDSAFIAVKN